MADDARKRILVVDDEDDVITYLTALLEDAGYAVTAARDGVQAQEALARERPDLISLDITMPEKSGVKFYREVRGDPDLAGIPILIVTGVSNPWSGPGGEGSFEKFISTRKQVPPPEGFFEKPIEPTVFLKKVKDLLGG